ncbi:hypothetical protein ES708_00706 [subsurface metagenome]
MSYKLRILSLGAGVQSSTILLMACKGLLPRPDAAIFADTGWETNATYIHLEWLKAEAGKHGIPIIVVDNGNIRANTLGAQVRGKRWVSMPLFTKQIGGYYTDYSNIHLEDGKRVWGAGVISLGLLRRQCTLEHKITPIKREIRRMLGIKPRCVAPKDCVEQWIGISTDEAQRIFTRQPSRESVMTYPLINLNMSRYDCMVWLRANYDIVVPKSSCVGCPYHSQKEWRALSEPEFKDACFFDEAIRHKGGVKGDLYLHRSCVPLSEVDLSTPEERGQVVFDFIKDDKLNLFVNNISIHTRSTTTLKPAKWGR